MVKIELWPGGDGRRRRELLRLEIVNLSQLEPISDYAVTALRDRKAVAEATVSNHRRARGFLPLVVESLRRIRKLLEDE